MKKIVVIGGGTGTYTVLSGIKHIDGLEITAIVTSADSGGSTGVLRDEFGNLPVGDFRQCIVALANEDDEDSNLLRNLFQYRFSKGGKGLVGHTFGNLYLTALIDVLGDEELAFRQASKILNIKGRVFPITLDQVNLVAEYEDGSIGYGEAMIDEPPAHHNGVQRIKRLWSQPKAKILERSNKAIREADYIILGPGDLYTSILANFTVDGSVAAVKNSEAKIIYIPNLVTKYGQTNGFTVSDHVREIENYLQCKIDYILQNNTDIPPKILRKYRVEKAYKVKDDLGDDPRIKRGDLISDVVMKQSKSDIVRRSLIRHDSRKIANLIASLID